MSANQTQIGGTHYTDMAIQPWDYMRECMSDEAFCGYLQGCCIKYLSRFHRKGGIEDLRKAAHYLTKLIETKEVMQFAGHAPVAQSATTPAVSESAAGAHPMYNGMPEKAWLLLAELHADAGYLFGRVAADGSVAAMMTNAVRAKIDAINAIFQPAPTAPTEWPGPDWSQAPVWAEGWVKQRKYTNGMWFAGDFRSRGESAAGWEFGAPHSGKEQWAQAPNFGYTGHWRDSLRKRPSRTVVHEETLGAVLS